MLTPQQIQEISFEKAIFGGYDMDSVDEVLEPLTADYLALYKENSVLKSKMRILVEKLEEYRNQEASMQSAILAAQRTCEQMTVEAEKKCAKMLRDAEEQAAFKVQNVDQMIGAEAARLEEAKQLSEQFIGSMERRLHRQLELLAQLREAEFPKMEPAAPEEEPDRVFDYDKHPRSPTTEEKADALIEEIGKQIEDSMDADEPSMPIDIETDGEAPAEEAPQKESPVTEDTTSLHGELSPAKLKAFEELNFGRNNKE
ncbi:MAG: DivIVA domain-containing protein [Oscillospiraceae bacterium]|nr:DivIVA domain-containing protein [Oscillospiraceae bacterium]